MDKELLKEAYERGCPLCGGSGAALSVTREHVQETLCVIKSDGSLDEISSGPILSNGFVSRVRCLACDKDVYINGEWA